MPAAISGQGGHARTYAAATVLVHGFCLTESEALDLLQRQFNPRCDPPWTDLELQHKVADAITNATAGLEGGWWIETPRCDPVNENWRRRSSSHLSKPPTRQTCIPTTRVQ
jgi:hypothetical protein